MSLFRSYAGAEEGAGPTLTPLIDMLFLLIVFFLVTSVFSQEEIDHRVELPVSRESQSLTNPAAALVINIRQDGALSLGSEALDLEGLEAKLRVIYAEHPGRPVVIRGDYRVVLQQCVPVMDALKRVGFAKFTLKCRN